METQELSDLQKKKPQKTKQKTNKAKKTQQEVLKRKFRHRQLIPEPTHHNPCAIHTSHQCSTVAVY